MVESKKYKTAFELFGSFIVFDNNNQISFAGGSITKLLSFSGIEIKDIVSEGFAGEDGKHLLTTLNKVRKNQRASSFSFKKAQHSFYIFPAHKTDKQNVVLSQKEDIDHFNKIERDLNERVKELECLYSISRETEVSNSIVESFQKCTEFIKQGFQYPEFTTVVIEYNGKKYISSGGSETKIKNLLSDENILKNARRLGEIRVIYHKKVPFLKEEIKLLREVSRKFTKAIEREERTNLLEKQKKILLSKNTKLLELTEESRRSKEQLQIFFKAFTDKIVVIDSNYNIILSNSDDIGNTGKCYSKLFNNAQQCTDCPALLTFKNSNSNIIDKKSGNQYFRIRSFPIYNNDGKVDRVLEVCRNITKEKKMESQLLESHKLASLGKLVAGVAHEINNPNTFILGNTKIIQEAFKDILPIIEKEHQINPDMRIARLDYDMFKENVITLIDDLYNGAVKIKKIVEELRNYAKKDEDNFTDSVNINDVVENTVRLIKKQIKENVSIVLDLNSELPEFNGNKSRLEQVIINLILNACHAIGNQTGEVKVITDYDSDSNNIIAIVKDTGKGMDEETKKSVFDPFFTTKRNEGGIGLGLSISYRIIKEHKGEIEIDSRIGKGTTFTILIPANQAENGTYISN